MADEGAMEVLSEEECFDLLATTMVGRLALTDADGDGPLVVPVNYVVDGHAIVFRSGPGTKLDLVHGGQAVSFQVDELDHVTKTGWSVLVRGTAYEAAHWEVAHVDPKPWAPGDRDHFVRIRAVRVSGRRLHAAALPWVFDSRAYL